MKLSGNTILITGGASGIGRALAEAFHRLGNQVIVAGRRRSHLDATLAANPGMGAVELDVADPASIAAVTRQLLADYPALNVLINNAGTMALDDPAQPVDDALLTTTMDVNFMGPVRMTSALIAHLKGQDAATIINVTSAMGFLPFAMGAVYSASKAALHAYTMALRYQLTGTPVTVLEIVPPWVQTDLLNSNEEPRAMPLDEFVAEAMQLLASGADEILVERVKPLRNSPGQHEAASFTRFNDLMLKA